jgi:phosphate transport system permease protein
MQSNLSPTTALGASVVMGGPDNRPLDLSGGRSRRFSEQVIHAVLFLCGAVSILTTVGIVVILVTQAVSFFTQVPITDFLFESRWTAAVSRTPIYGVLGLVVGTVVIAAIAMLVAIPLGLASAIYLSEYAAPASAASSSRLSSSWPASPLLSMATSP